MVSIIFGNEKIKKNKKTAKSMFRLMCGTFKLKNVAILSGPVKKKRKKEKRKNGLKRGQ